MRARRFAVAGLLALTACQSATAASPRPTPTPAAHRQVVLAAADFPPPIVRPVFHYPKRRAPRLYDGTRRLFPGHRIVAFYGAAGTAALGVLGAGNPDRVWPRLARQARAYRSRHVHVVPAYELITFEATSSRGNQRNYSSRIADHTLNRYARAARRHHALLILDIQPGHGRFLPDAKTLRPWLRLPYVGLALDPEWKLYGAQRPLQQIGHTGAGAVNATSRWLNRLTARHRLPQKLFLVHQFTEAMVRDRSAVRTRSQLATVFNVDGFGGRPEKIGKYRELAAHSHTRMGFKLFYDWDRQLLRPTQVLRLRPQPRVIEYQ